VPASAFEEAGAAWFVDSAWPGVEGWVDDLAQPTAAGPSGR